MDRTWKEKLASLPREIRTRSRVAVAGLEPRINAISMNAKNNLRAHPAKWAGIAVGTGLGIGFIGRFLQRRAQNRRMPAIVIIEAC
jgi:hypothetical protein